MKKVNQLVVVAMLVSSMSFAAVNEGATCRESTWTDWVSSVMNVGTSGAWLVGSVAAAAMLHDYALQTVTETSSIRSPTYALVVGAATAALIRAGKFPVVSSIVKKFKTE